MSELYTPISEVAGDRANYGTIERDSESVLRKSGKTVWNSFNLKQPTISKLYTSFVFGFLLLWAIYKCSVYTPHGSSNEKDTAPNSPLDGESNFIVDLTTYQTLFIIVNTTAAIADVEIIANRNRDTKFAHIASDIFPQDLYDNQVYFQETREEDRYFLVLNTRNTNLRANVTIRIYLPSKQPSLKNLNIILPVGKVNGSTLTHSHFDNLNVKVDTGVIAFEVSESSYFDVRSSNITLQTSVGDISGTYSFSQAYSALSSQGNVDCRLRVAPRSIPDISVGTSVGNVTARVTDTFRGSFSLFAKHGRTYISGIRHMDYSTNTTSAKNGFFHGEKANSNISLYTNQGRIVLAFRRRI
ncbi:hypothetical protein K7432_005568 [Basidiobolus ranarum]|uniref:Adhesin domain-containing protein n=1 Tax=Basidiobolus ranarum TaxID=34480 RepID=A0ABR2W2W6_9FUNG